MTQEEKYEDFKLFLYDLEQEERKQNPGFKLTDIFYKFRPENKQIHDRIINRVLSYGSSEAELADLVEAVKTSKVGAWYQKKDRDSLLNIQIDKNINRYHASEAIIHDYMCYYYNKFFRVEDGKIIFTGMDEFDYTQIDSSEKKKHYVSDYYPLIILNNGESYFSHLHHQELAGWLTAQGKSIKGAIRMMVNERKKTINICDISTYDYSDESKKKEDFVLTSAQSTALYNICIKRFGATMGVINQMVMMSDIFGNGASKNLKRTEMKNLYELEDSFNGHFSISEYIDGLKVRANRLEWGS